MTTLFPTNRESPIDVYTDGGVIGVNPSQVGGTWAWCFVDTRTGERIDEASGVVRPPFHGLPRITNNLTEYLAGLLALEAVPAGWDGTLHMDSQLTLARFAGRASCNGIPIELRDRLRIAKRRLGCFELAWVRGHNGNPHNEYCDKLCNAQGRPILRARKRRRASVA